LIVEDDTATADALRSIFVRKGCDVIHADTVHRGLKALLKHPDYVILDLMLPDGDGIEILHEVKATGGKPRIVVTTAITDPARLREVHALQPHRVLRKPLDLVDLLSAIGMM
jgi:two-component system, OmpR family, KDP operon response regulator KdpE